MTVSVIPSSWLPAIGMTEFLTEREVPASWNVFEHHILRAYHAFDDQVLSAESASHAQILIQARRDWVVWVSEEMWDWSRTALPSGHYLSLHPPTVMGHPLVLTPGLSVAYVLAGRMP